LIFCRLSIINPGTEKSKYKTEKSDGLLNNFLINLLLQKINKKLNFKD